MLKLTVLLSTMHAPKKIQSRLVDLQCRVVVSTALSNSSTQTLSEEPAPAKRHHADADKPRPQHSAAVARPMRPAH